MTAHTPTDPTETISPDKRGIQSVDAALAILNTVALAAGPQALTTIAKRSGHSPSTTHRHLVSLQRGGLVRQEPGTGHYDLGSAALQLGLSALKRMDAVEVAQSHAARLATETGTACFVSIWSDDGPMIVRWFHGRRMIMTMAGVGSVLPLLESSSGLVFAAYLPAHLMTTWLDTHQLASTDLETLRRQVRDPGFAWVNGQMVSGLRGVSVPVLDMFEEVRCTLTLLSPDPALVSFPNDAQQQLLSAGESASMQLGYRKPEAQARPAVRRARALA